MVAHQRTASNSTWGVQEAFERPGELAQEYPLSSMLVVFGAGLGIGILLGQCLAEPLNQMMQPQQTTTERLGRQMLDYMHSILPASVARQLPS